MADDRDPERQPLLADVASEEVHDVDTASASRHNVSTIANKSTADIADTKSEWQVVMAIASSWIGVVLASMDSSIMATLTGPISESFDSFQLMSWMINSFLVTVVMVQPLSGKLSDIYGRRAGLLWSNTMFLIGNLVCGLAKKDWHFILGRAVAGLGAGALHTISTFLISDLIPLRSRGFWQGVSNIAYGTGFAIGGYFGGFVNDRFGWRWAFLCQPIPIIVSIILVYRLLDASTTAQAPSLRRIDFLGSITLSLALLFLLFGAISGGNIIPWSSPLVYVPLAISPCFLIIFGYVEERVAREPIIPVSLLRIPSVLGACLTYWFVMMGYQAIIYYFPLFLEVRGMMPAQSGLRLIPNAIGTFAGSLGAGAVMNLTGKYYLLGMFHQFTLIGTGVLVLVTLSKVVFSWPPFVYMFLNGFGLGGLITVMLVAVISAASHEHHATLTSASYAFRSTGQVIGVTTAGAIFQNILKQQLWARLGDQPGAEKYIDIIRRKMSPTKDLPPQWAHDMTQSYEAAFRGVWCFILAAFVAGAFAAAIVRENRLHRTLDRK